MTIAYPAFNLYCELEECTVLNLVIENQQIFSDVISDIYDQCSGESGRLILSENNEPLELRKRSELITQIIPFEINQRDLVNKLYAGIDLINRHKTQAICTIHFIDGTIPVIIFRNDSR